MKKKTENKPVTNAVVPVDEKKTETKRQKFIRLANKRVNTAIKKILWIGNLSATSQYEYTAEDVAHIEEAFSVAVSSVLAKFSGHTNISEMFEIEATKEGLI